MVPNAILANFIQNKAEEAKRTYCCASDDQRSYEYKLAVSRRVAVQIIYFCNAFRELLLRWV